MDMAMFHSGWTVLLVATFIGIVVWAFSGRRKQRFDEAAHIPLNDDVPADSPGDRPHG